MDLNKVMLIGNVGQEPTYHTMGSGGELCKFGLATTRKWKDKKTGEKREDTSWHNIVVFNPYLVGICQGMVQKGTRLYLEGEVKTRTYEKDGEKKYITEIIIPQVKGELFILARGKGWDVNETPGSHRNRSGSSGEGMQTAGAAASAAVDSPKADYDDDIPF